MLQDARANKDVIITKIDPDIIKADLKKIENKLKVPIEEFHIPKVEDIQYTIGSQWKQRYLIEKEGTLFIAPTQFNAETGRWVNYHEHDWQKRPWLKKCGGCHAALPKTELFEKRATIVNPAKLTAGVAVQICGSCHNRGKSTNVFIAGQALAAAPNAYEEASSGYFRDEDTLPGAYLQYRQSKITVPLSGD